MSSRRLTWGISIVAGLTFFLFGYDQGDLAGLLTIDSFRASFPRLDSLSAPGDGQTALIQGASVGAWNIGCFASALLTIGWGEVVGRKNTIFAGISFLIVGEVLQATSFSLSQFVVGRFVAGFGNGFTTATVPAWQAECTKAHRRGTLLMISAGACIAAGLSFSYWMAFACSWLTSSAAWRLPIAVQLIFAFVAILLLLPLPESPRWLILTGREAKALQTLAALNDREVNHPQTRSDFIEIKDAVLELSKADFTTALTMGDYRHLHRMVLAVLLQVFQQATGINLIIQYLPLMLIQQYGYGLWQGRLVAAGGGTAFFVASFVAVVGIDRFWGRRSLMLFGATGMCSSMTILTIMAFLNTNASSIVGTVFIFAFLVFFAIGWQGMSWLYAAEISPLRARGPINAIATASNWLSNYVVILVTPLMFARIGYRTYIVFAVTNCLIIPAVYIFYPETGYRCLEEVDQIFYNASLTSNPWRSVKRIAAEQPIWYGRDGKAVFDYEKTSWHLQHKAISSSSEKEDSSSAEHSSASNTSPVGLAPDGAALEVCPAPVVPRLSAEDVRVVRHPWLHRFLSM